MTSSTWSSWLQPLRVTAASNVLRRGLPSRVATSTVASPATSSARVASAWGSRSTTSVGTPFVSAEEASPRVMEVLPTPPFKLHTLTTITALTLPVPTMTTCRDGPNGQGGSRPDGGSGSAGPPGRETSGRFPGSCRPRTGEPVPAVTGRCRAPKGQFSPEPLRRQDRTSEATLESSFASRSSTEGEATGGRCSSAGARTNSGGASMTSSLTATPAPPVLDEASDPRTPATSFADRHIGPDPGDVEAMLKTVGHASLADLVAAVVPPVIRTHESLPVEPAVSEPEVLAELRALAARNTVAVPMIGLGYHGTTTPGVIRRNVLENPAWYTAYTPYQPEISQGRLEALLNFQTVVEDLTGLPVANASLLDEATAAAEAMTLMRRTAKAPAGAVLVVDADVLPQTKAVVAPRAEPLGIRVVEVDLSAAPAQQVLDGVGADVFGVLVQYPGTSGAVRDLAPIAEAAHARGALLAVAADLLALTLLTSPGEAGADVAIGTSPRLGRAAGL